MGREDRPDAELAPTIVRCPPANVLWSSVFPESLDRGAFTFPLSAGESRSIGANRSLLQAIASSSVGRTTRIGAGSWSMKYPTTLLMTSVLPTCDAAIQHTRRTSGSEITSMISRRYGVRSVRHLPGSALASGERTRYLSAHSETVRRGGGFRSVRQIASARRIHSSSASGRVRRGADRSVLVATE